MDAIKRRGGPVARMLLSFLFLPLLCGCLHRWTRESNHSSDAASDAQSFNSQYYEEVAASSDHPYKTRPTLEIPDTPPPFTVTNPEGGARWEMTLQEALEIALRNSEIVRSLRGGVATAVATAWEPAIAETRIQEEMGRFDANLILNMFWSKAEEQLLNNVSPGGPTVGAGAIFRDENFGGSVSRQTGLPGSGDVLSIRKLFANGMEATVGFNTDYSFPTANIAFSRLFPAAYESKVFTTVRLPLLQGRGVDVNRAPIEIARLRSDQAMVEYKQRLMQLVQEVEQTYWQLAAAQVQVWATEQAIRVNLEAVRQLEVRLKAGTVNAGDLAEAKQQLFQLTRRRELALSGSPGEVSVTASGVRAGGVLFVERELRGLLGLPPSDGKRIVATDDPSIAPVTLDWKGLLAEAYAHNPELERLRLAVDEQREIVRATRNTLKPRLDVFARKEYAGLGSDLSRSMDQLTDNRFGQWVIGFQYEKSLGYNQASARTQQAMHQAAQARQLLQDKGVEIQAALNRDYQDVELRVKTYKMAVAAREAAEQGLEVRRSLFDKGELQIDRLLPAVQNYVEAVSSEYQDKVQYQEALSNLEVTKGTILRYNNILLQEGPWSDAAYPQAARQIKARDRALELRHGRKKCEDELEAAPQYQAPAQATPPRAEARRQSPTAAPAGATPTDPAPPVSEEPEAVPAPNGPSLDLRTNDAAKTNDTAASGSSLNVRADGAAKPTGAARAGESAKTAVATRSSAGAATGQLLLLPVSANADAKPRPEPAESKPDQPRTAWKAAN